MKIPIFTDEVAQDGGWHGAMLKAAFAKRGHEAVLIDLRDCVLDLAGDVAKIHLPQFDETPRLAFVRGIAAGTLQQVITRLNLLHILRLQGVVVYNDGKAIERTVDKGMTSFLLKQAGIRTPDTWVMESRALAHARIAQQLTHADELVIKPLFGSQGQGVRLLNINKPLPLPKDTFVDGVFYLQTKINTGGTNHDYRVFIVQNKAIAGMQRCGTGWLNNVAQGAQCLPIKEDAIFILAERAAMAIGIDYCGVDIIRDAEGNLHVLEVNSIPAWFGLQAVSAVSIAQALVDDCLRQL